MSENLPTLLGIFARINFMSSFCKMSVSKVCRNFLEFLRGSRQFVIKSRKFTEIPSKFSVLKILKLSVKESKDGEICCTSQKFQRNFEKLGNFSRMLENLL